MGTRTDYAVCMLCEAICGIAVEHDGKRVHKIRGDAEDPFSRGHLCPKGVALADVQNDPERIRQPMRRRRDGSDRWDEIGWDEALDLAAGRLAEIQQRHGRDAVALYRGNPTSHSYSAVLFISLLKDQLGSRNVYSASPVDTLPRTLMSATLYGNQAVLPIPDLDRTSFLLALGANPAVSNGSVMTAPDVVARLRAIRERGGRVVVVDPRRTETAELADTHLFIRPGTDALLVASLLNVVFREGLAKPGRLASLVEGLEEIPALVAPYTPERVAPQVGIPAEAIARLARDFAAAPSAVCYGRMGTCVQEFGATTNWLVDLLNIATGNLDRPGGAMFTTPAADLPTVAAMLGQVGHFGRWRSRVSNLPEFNGELPVACFAEEIETPGPGQIRALLTHAGNPVLSLPNGARLDRAYPKLEFMVAIDVYLNETTRHADLILPPSFGLEHEHYPVIFHGVAIRNTAHYSPAVLDKPPGALHDWEILVGLTARLARARGGRGALAARAKAWLARRIGPRGLLALMLRFGPHKLRLSQLEAAPHGIDLGPLEPRLPGILRGRTKIPLVPELVRADLPRLARRLAEPARLGADGLVLISRRTLRSNNSWMHNSERLVSGRHRCVLLIHPEDAAQRGLAEGARVTLKSRAGEIEVPIQVSDEIMPGVVSLPHGWGHGRPGTRLGVAAAHPGASVNDVTDESFIDPVSGAAALSGVPVTVSLARP
ncbi:MAG TPA: molybdopterin-dependent oxidoreductase [Myxococcota bacterium]|jgi:anaerobic selenocysteine-containing dehydrogenase